MAQNYKYTLEEQTRLKLMILAKLKPHKAALDCFYYARYGYRQERRLEELKQLNVLTKDFINNCILYFIEELDKQTNKK